MTEPAKKLGRDRAIELVGEGALPLSLGAPQRVAMVLEQDGVFRIRELVIDRDGAEAAAAANNRARTPSWMPSHAFLAGKPTGTIHAEAATRDELIATMRTMTWPPSW